MEYLLSITYNQKPGFVIRIALILERRNFEIKSLIIEEKESYKFSEMKLKVYGPEEKIEQVEKQIAKLIDVVRVEKFMEMELV